eukprot:6341023-Prymnesium_polylepis.1
MPPRSGRETSACTVCAPKHPYPVAGTRVDSYIFIKGPPPCPVRFRPSVFLYTSMARSAETTVRCRSVHIGRSGPAPSAERSLPS